MRNLSLSLHITQMLRSIGGFDPAVTKTTLNRIVRDMQPHARIDRIYVENDDKDRVEEINMKEEVWIEREDQKTDCDRDERTLVTRSSKENLGEGGMLGSDQSLDQKLSGSSRRNLSFRSKKQTVKTRSVDAANNSGTAMEKNLFIWKK